MQDGQGNTHHRWRRLERLLREAGALLVELERDHYLEVVRARAGHRPPGRRRALDRKTARALLALKGRATQRAAGERHGISRSVVQALWAGTRYGQLTGAAR